MSVLIEDIDVENPTGVWMQLMNARRNVLNSRTRWNPGGWFEMTSHQAGAFTMCLANAVRFVANGNMSQPDEHAYRSGGDEEMEVAERIVMVAIQQAATAGYFGSIPEYNDTGQRRYHEIIKVLDTAIEIVEPFARSEAIIFADDVMTDEERKEVARAVRKAEDEMWAEQVAKFKLRKDTKGMWRTAKGHFAKVPLWVRYGLDRDPAPIKVKAEAIKLQPAAKAEAIEFKGWLDNHEKRGWESFWDELLQCDKDDPGYKECQAAKEALALV
jgi:hypothetical protein